MDANQERPSFAFRLRRYRPDDSLSCYRWEQEEIVLVGKVQSLLTQKEETLERKIPEVTSRWARNTRDWRLAKAI